MTDVVELGQLEIPQAQRARRAGWRDPRLWVGVGLVAVSVVAGAQVVGSTDDSVEVWAARHDVAAGTVLGEDDLVHKQVRFADPADAALYLPASAGLPVRRHLARTLGPGELLPRAGLAEAPDGQVQLSLSVSLPAAQVPPSVRPGGVVDLWSVPQGSASSKEARLLVREVLVLEAPSSGSDLTGGAAERQVVLAVPDGDESVAEVVAASGSGALMLVGRR